MILEIKYEFDIGDTVINTHENDGLFRKMFYKKYSKGIVSNKIKNRKGFILGHNNVYKVERSYFTNTLREHLFIENYFLPCRMILIEKTEEFFEDAKIFVDGNEVH